MLISLKSGFKSRSFGFFPAFHCITAQQKFALLQIFHDSTAHGSTMLTVKLVEKLVEKDQISIALFWAGRIPNGLNFSEYMNFQRRGTYPT